MNIGFILLSLLILSLLIMVHEFGHYSMARMLKIQVYEFAIGMGPKLWGRRKGKTLYSIRAIPMGGYCAFDSAETLTTGSPEFNTHPVWKRMLVIFAGPLMNTLLALLLVFVILVGIGMPTVVPRIQDISPNSPAVAAGLKAGDEILSINGQSINSDVTRLQQVQQAEAAKGIELKYDVKRDGMKLTIPVTPDFDETQNKWLIGITLAQENQRISAWRAFPESVTMTIDFVKGTVQGLVGLIFHGQGASDVMGPVGITSMIADTARNQGIASLFMLIALISINLSVVNLIPFPALDGSKIVLLIVEAVRRKPIAIEKEGIIQAIGLGLFVLLFVFMVFRDITKLTGGG